MLRSLLNSISPFFNAPLSSIPAGYEWESRRGRFRWRRRSLAFIGERRSPPRAEDCNFEARLFAQGFLSLFLSSLSLLSWLFLSSSDRRPPIRLLSRLSYFSFLTRLRESHFQSITDVWLPRSRKMYTPKGRVPLSSLRSLALSLLMITLHG